jgi:hypothetical protein
MGGIDVVVYVITPIFISLLWVNISGMNDIGTFIMYGAGLISSAFRGIKIGWFKND